MLEFEKLQSKNFVEFYLEDEIVLSIPKIAGSKWNSKRLIDYSATCWSTNVEYLWLGRWYAQ